MSTWIRDGGTIIKDPNSSEVFLMDWGTSHLAAAAEISTSTFTIAGADAILTADNPSILTGNRSTQVRLSAGTTGRTYTVTNRIVTNESPAQTKDASFKVLIEER
jgi:hypothetical protein